ncbi:hypothetical protein BD779DRAFT_1684074 [Infundibulicybe gibba]|nr:hypothetical protein BD779DRAFT_1684074 [Infundibulicybe gibba]
MRFPRLVWDEPSSRPVKRFADEAGFKIDGDLLPSPRVRNVELLHVDRRKSLPTLPSTRRYWAYFVICIVLIAGIAVGTTLGVMKARSRQTPTPGLPQQTTIIVVTTFESDGFAETAAETFTTVVPAPTLTARANTDDDDGR